ncbi:MAG: glycerol-3-phosphate dehydrogenase [Geminicoccaceae bacterium]
MASITIIGSGVMGTSIAVPALDNGHEVTLVGSPLDDAVIETLREGGMHPKLDRPLAGEVTYRRHDELAVEHLRGAEIVLLGVSNAGIPWSLDYFRSSGVPIKRLMLLANGLDVTEDGGVRTLSLRISEAMSTLGPAPAVVGVGGPCIARELANRAPTAAVFGGERAAAVFCKKVFETSYYHVRPSSDLIGVEANAALKSFMAIGVAATASRFPDPVRDDARQINPTAAVFEQAVHELALLTQWLGGHPLTALRLAGAGDLFATVNAAGSNARLGLRFGAGDNVNQALAGPLKGETVEGVDTARALGPGLYKAWQRDPVLAAEMPLTRALLNAILHDEPFAFDMGAYWHRND